MKNAKIFKSIFSLFVVLGLVVSFVGCVETVKYKVAFQSEGMIVAEVEIEEGKTLTVDQVPANPSKEGYEFVGWFNGEVELNIATAVNSNITYVAKFEKLPEPEPVVYTITFKVDEEVVKEVTVEEGETIDVTAVPADPLQKAFTFVGWFNGETEFNEETKVTEDVTYIARFERSHYVVTFGEEEVLVAVSEVLSLSDVEEPVQEGAYFVGWFAGEVKAVEGMKLEEDMAFVAQFVTLESFDGTWANQDGVWFVIENGVVVNGLFGETGKTFTFDATTGKLGYKSSSYYPDNHYFVVTMEGLIYIHSYWDDIYEEMAEDQTELLQQETSVYEGNYRADNSSYITIIAGGIVTKYNGSQTKTGILKEVDGSLVIQYATLSVSEKTVPVDFDETGNIVAEGKIYVKNADSFSYLYLSQYPTFYFFTVDSEQVVVVRDETTSYYGTLEGTLALDEIVMVYYNETSVTLKVTGNTTYVVAGEEQGTYTAGENTLVLDGFGTATLNGVVSTYDINSIGVILIADAGYALDVEQGTYETLEKDTVNTGTYIYNENDKYTLVLDGFGGAMLTYTSSYGVTSYKGTYTLSDSTITISGVNYYANGTWTLEEDGKVLSNSGKIYLLEGATFTDVKEELNGVYGETGEVVVTTGKVVVDGTEYVLSYNYNGSKASYEVKHSDANEYGYTAEFTDVITISRTAEGNLLVETAHEGWDEYSEYAEITYSQEILPAYVVTELDAFAGTWVGSNAAGVTVTFVFNGDGTGTTNGDAITYTVSENTLSFTYNYAIYYTLSGDPSTGKLTVAWEDDESSYPSFEAVKQGGSEDPELDAFAGTWVGTLFGSQMTFVIYGDGTGEFNGTAMKYTISGNRLSFEYADGEYALVGDPSTGTLSTEWTYDGGYEDGSSYNVTKQ